MSILSACHVYLSFYVVFCRIPYYACVFVFIMHVSFIRFYFFLLRITIRFLFFSLLFFWWLQNSPSSSGQESLGQRTAVDRAITTNGGSNEERNGDRSSLTSTSSGSGGLGSPISLTSNASSAPELNGALGMGASFLVVYHRKMVFQMTSYPAPLLSMLLSFYFGRFAKIFTSFLLTRRGLVFLDYLCWSHCRGRRMRPMEKIAIECWRFRLPVKTYIDVYGR